MGQRCGAAASRAKTSSDSRLHQVPCGEEATAASHYSAVRACGDERCGARRRRSRRAPARRGRLVLRQCGAGRGSAARPARQAVVRFGHARVAAFRHGRTAGPRPEPQHAANPPLAAAAGRLPRRRGRDGETAPAEPAVGGRLGRPRPGLRTLRRQPEWSTFSPATGTTSPIPRPFLLPPSPLLLAFLLSLPPSPRRSPTGIQSRTRAASFPRVRSREPSRPRAASRGGEGSAPFLRIV